MAASEKCSFNTDYYPALFLEHFSDALRDLVPFVEFKKLEKHP